MPVIVRGRDVAAEEVGPGVVARSLLSPAKTGSNDIFLDLLTFDGGASFDLAMNDDAFGWLQVLEGSGRVAGCDQDLDPNVVAYLPLGFCGPFIAATDATRLLIATVPEARRFDPDTTPARASTWRPEP